MSIKPKIPQTCITEHPHSSAPMPPRKKPNSSSSSSSAAKKSSHNSNQPQQPSKFNIQHFFDCHTQNASQNPKPFLTSNAVVSTLVLTDRSNENRPASKKPDRNDAILQNTPEENVVLVGVNAADENLAEVSPEVSKSMSLKCFKFSPGMLSFSAAKPRSDPCVRRGGCTMV